MERQVQLFRTRSGPQGTEGILLFETLQFFSLELPWRDNSANISCIPAQSYPVSPRISPKFGETYHVQNVTDRSHILIHSGNFAGDKAMGFRTNVQGCILLGKKRGIIQGQRAVLSSRIAIQEFSRAMGKNNFQLTIHQDYSG